MITETQIIAALVECYKSDMSLERKFPELTAAWKLIPSSDRDRLARAAREQLRPKFRLEEFFYEMLPTMSRLADEDGREFALHSWEKGDGSGSFVVMFMEGDTKHVKRMIEAVVVAGEQLVMEEKGAQYRRRSIDPGS